MSFVDIISICNLSSLLEFVSTFCLFIFRIHMLLKLPWYQKDKPYHHEDLKKSKRVLLLTYKKYKKETNDPVLFITTHHWKPSSVVWLFFFHSIILLFAHTHSFYCLTKKNEHFPNVTAPAKQNTSTHTQKWHKGIQKYEIFWKTSHLYMYTKMKKKKTLFHLLIWFMSFHLPIHMVFGVWTKSVRMKMYEIMWKHIFLPFCQSYFRAIIKCWVKLCMYA